MSDSRYGDVGGEELVGSSKAMSSKKPPRRRKAHHTKPPVGPYAHLTPRIERDADGKPAAAALQMNDDDPHGILDRHPERPVEATDRCPDSGRQVQDCPSCTVAVMLTRHIWRNRLAKCVCGGSVKTRFAAGGDDTCEDCGKQGAWA